MTQPRKPRVGRKRWGPLVRYLTETMQTAQSERLRMQAALRLADILTLREQREQLELRRELRVAKGDESSAAEQAKEREESVDEFLERVRQERNVTATGGGN